MELEELSAPWRRAYERAVRSEFQSASVTLTNGGTCTSGKWHSRKKAHFQQPGLFNRLPSLSGRLYYLKLPYGGDSRL